MENHTFTILHSAASCRVVAAAECGRAMSGSGGRTRPRHVGRWRPRAAAPCRVAVMGHGTMVICTVAERCHATSCFRFPFSTFRLPFSNFQPRKRTAFIGWVYSQRIIRGVRGIYRPVTGRPCVACVLLTHNFSSTDSISKKKYISLVRSQLTYLLLADMEPLISDKR